MDKKPLVSVIVPIYNAGTKLERCINSILSQTYSPIELILVDDGSKDDSLSICLLYQEKDPRVNVIHQENAGVSVARNVGLETMKGEYFCFVDADDYVDKEYVEKMYVALQNDDAQLAICGFNRTAGRKTRVLSCPRDSIVGKKSIADFVLKHYLHDLSCLSASMFPFVITVALLQWLPDAKKEAIND